MVYAVRLIAVITRKNNLDQFLYDINYDLLVRLVKQVNLVNCPVRLIIPQDILYNSRYFIFNRIFHNTHCFPFPQYFPMNCQEITS